MTKPKTDQQSGFTIIELLIATTIVSVILLMVSVIMISIGNLYFKGINQSRAQQDAREIADEIAEHIQLTDHAPVPGANGPVNWVCIGSTRYTYILGVQIGTDPGQVRHVLWRDNITSGSCPDPTNGNPGIMNTDLNATQLAGGSNGTELIAPRSRLGAFSISGSATAPYQIAIDIGYGDDDLLCSPSVAGSCSTSTAMSSAADYSHGDLTCKGHEGDSYCATASLTTSVVQRL